MPPIINDETNTHEYDSLIEWNSAYNLSIDEIDYHHQKLVRLLNKFYAYALEKQPSDKLLNLVHELKDYAHYHFFTEEQLMHQHQYPKLQAHLRAHNEFINTINHFEAQVRTNSFILTQCITTFLRDWFIQHIQKMDRDYSVYFAQLPKYKT